MILGSTERRSLLSSLRRAPFIQFSQLVITGVPVPSGEGVGGSLYVAPALYTCPVSLQLRRQTGKASAQWIKWA